MGLPSNTPGHWVAWDHHFSYPLMWGPWALLILLFRIIITITINILLWSLWKHNHRMILTVQIYTILPPNSCSTHFTRLIWFLSTSNNEFIDITELQSLCTQPITLVPSGYSKTWVQTEQNSQWCVWEGGQCLPTRLSAWSESPGSKRISRCFHEQQTWHMTALSDGILGVVFEYLLLTNIHT
jgi:hypothetical protein